MKIPTLPLFLLVLCAACGGDAPRDAVREAASPAAPRPAAPSPPAGSGAMLIVSQLTGELEP